MRPKSPLVNEYIDIVKSIPQDEGIIFFVFKPRYENGRLISHQAIIEAGLMRNGIDPEQTVENNGALKKRFAWITHGNETSLSKYSYCKNEIWVGVLHRDLIELASKVAGQADNLLHDIPYSLIQDVCESEISYCYPSGFCPLCLQKSFKR